MHIRPHVIAVNCDRMWYRHGYRRMRQPPAQPAPGATGGTTPSRCPQLTPRPSPSSRQAAHHVRVRACSFAAPRTRTTWQSNRSPKCMAERLALCTVMHDMQSSQRGVCPPPAARLGTATKTRPQTQPFRNRLLRAAAKICRRDSHAHERRGVRQSAGEGWRCARAQHGTPTARGSRFVAAPLLLPQL